MKVNFNDHKLVSNNHGLTEIHVVWAYPPSLHYNLWFSVCLFVRYGPYLVIEKSAHVHLERWKHGNRDTGLNMACT